MRHSCFIFLCVACGLTSLARAAQGPNVLFILTDDQRWDCIGCYEKPFLGMKTPNLDRLASEGARFRNMFCTTSLCSPSRASYLSGLYAHTHGVVNNFTEYPEDLPSWPKQLKASGYTTAYIGKWHMGEDNDSPRTGFDYWASHKGQGQYYDTKFNINGTETPTKGYYTHTVTKLATDWLRQPRDVPFCMILGQKAPHGPFVPEPKYEHLYDDVPIEYPLTSFQMDDKPTWYKERLDTWHGIYGSLYGFRENVPDRSAEGVTTFAKFVRSYAATIRSVDESVGEIYKTLADLGQLDNTIIVFAADNSFLLGEHGMIDKRTMHEESIRIPLLVRYPKVIKPGMIVDSMVLNIDLAPSILDLCDAPSLPKTHGRSWRPLVGVDSSASGGANDWRKSWFYEYNYEKQFPYTPNVRGVRTDTMKYVHYPHGDGGPDRYIAEVYDLADDPQESKNLIADPAHAADVTQLQAELTRLMTATDALPDKMPLDEGIKTQLPEKSIR